MASGETLKSPKIGGDERQEQREGAASSPSQQLLRGVQRREHEEMRETPEALTKDGDAKHESTEPYFLPHDEALQGMKHQLTESETEAMNAHVQKTVDDLLRFGDFAATETPQTEEERIPIVPETCEDSTVARTAPALISRAELFRKIATRLIARRHHSVSSEWETIDSISETSNKENLEPMRLLQKDIQSATTALGKPRRNTNVPSWMAYNLEKGNRKPSDLQSATFSISVKNRQRASSKSRQRIRLKPNVITRAGENGPESYLFSPIPICYNRAYVRRPTTPSIHSRGSELDCSSPLFLKSCERAIRGKRDLGELCGGLSAPNARRNTKTEQISRADFRILEWLKDIDVNTDLKSSSESALKLKRDIESGEVVRSAAETFSEALQGRSLQYPERAFDVLRDKAVSNGSNSALSRGIKLPPLNALRDISNLRRPNYLAKNSFARLNTLPKAKSVSKKGRANLSTRIEKIQAPSPNMATRTARQPAGNSSPRFNQLLNKLRRHEQTLSMFSFEPNIARRDQFEYALACLEGRVSSRVACERRDVRSQQVTKKAKTRTLRTESPALVERADEPTTSTFSFEPDEERRKHLKFSLARLEGRVEPQTPSPIQRFVHTHGVYSEHVEWERGSTEVARPVAEKVKLSGDSYGAGIEYLEEFNVGELEESRGPLDEYRSSQDIADNEQRWEPSGHPLEGLMKRLGELVLEPLIEGMD